MSATAWAFLAVLGVSAISFVGALTLVFQRQTLDRLIPPAVGFAAGTLVSAAFLDLLPEALRGAADPLFPLGMALAGLLVFFVFESLLHSYHRRGHRHGVAARSVPLDDEAAAAAGPAAGSHPDGGERPLSFAYLILFGGALHNVLDGMAIGTAFVLDRRLGLITTLSIVAHEIPRELGDFGVLIYAGFRPTRALFYNFLSAVTAVAGTAAVVLFTPEPLTFARTFLPFAAGGFVYVAVGDLIPEFQEHPVRQSVGQMLWLLLGVGVIAAATFVTGVR